MTGKLGEGRAQRGGAWNRKRLAGEEIRVMRDEIGEISTVKTLEQGQIGKGSEGSGEGRDQIGVKSDRGRGEVGWGKEWSGVISEWGRLGTWRSERG